MNERIDMRSEGKVRNPPEKRHDKGNKAHTHAHMHKRRRMFLFFADGRGVKMLILFPHSFSYLFTFSIILGDERKAHLCTHSVFSSCLYTTPRGTRQIHTSVLILSVKSLNTTSKASP